MEHKLAFSTFMKLIELDDKPKQTTLRGFLRGGGFNYWRPLQSLAKKVANGELDVASLQDEVAHRSKGHQRKYNTNALTKLLFWASRRSITVRREPGPKIVKLTKSGLSVKIAPELAFIMQGNKYLMHIWATNSPSLSEETLSTALYFFKSEIDEKYKNGWNFLIFDTVKDRVFGELDILQNAPEMLAAEGKNLGVLWDKVNHPVSSDESNSIDGSEDQPSILN